MPSLLQQIEGGELARVYYLCGEAFERDRIVTAIKRAVLGEAEANAFNYDALDGSRVSGEAIAAAARTLPMLGGSRLVMVRDAHELKADQLERLLPYVKDPSPHAVLVLVAEKVDLRLKFFNQLRKTGVVQRFEPLKERDAPRWLAEEAQRQQVRLQPGVAQRIADAVGADRGQLAGALERVALYVGSGQPIRIADVEDVLAETRQRSIFELTNAVGAGKRREAMLVLRRMQHGREPPLRVVAMLVRHVRQLWMVAELASSGLAKKEIASQVGIHPYFVNDMLRQSERFGPSTLRRTHQTLCDLDRELKSSRVNGATLLDRAVLRLCDG
jgi:DNA polymerase-3 subunit delta